MSSIPEPTVECEAEIPILFVESSSEHLFTAMQALTRLCVGGMLELSDELFRQIAQWDETLPSPSSSHATSAESEMARLRHAAIGLLFASQEQLYYRTVTMGRRASATARWLTAGLTPFQRLRVVRRGMREAEAFRMRGERVVEEWVRRGRAEEQQGRRIAQRTVEGVIDELLAYLEADPHIRELIEQQSVGLASTVVDEVRERAVTADTWVEHLVHALVRRRANSPAKSMASQPTEATEATEASP
jgi:hypothetical protein